VLATLKLKLKRSTQPQSRHFIPNLSSLSNIDVSREYAVNVSSKLKATFLEDQSLEAMWGHYKSALDFAARKVLGKRLCAMKPWISQVTLAIIDQRRQAIRRGDVEEYRRLAGPRRRSLWHDKQQWTEQVASTGENHLLCGEIKDAFASFRQLKQKCANSSALYSIGPHSLPLMIWYLKHRHPRQIPPLIPSLLRSLMSIKP